VGHSETLRSAFSAQGKGQLTPYLADMNRKIFWALGWTLVASQALGQTPTNIEAAEWNPVTDRWLVSNGSNILSTLDGDEWSVFGEAQGSHGMEVIGGQLFTTSGNLVRAYDASTGSFLGSLSVSGASFLNGMGSRPGIIYVSDFSGGRIHAIDVSDPAAMTESVLVPNTPCTPNGVTWDAGESRLLFVCWGGGADIHAVDVETGEARQVVDNTGLGNLDGLDGDGAGTFYVSSWSPARITRYTDNFQQAETVVSTGLASPADISWNPTSQVLGVANSGNQTLTLHDFSGTSGMGNFAPKSGNPCSVQHLSHSTWVAQKGTLGAWHCSVGDSAGRLLAEADHFISNFPAELDFNIDFPGAQWVVWTDPSGCQTQVTLGPHRR